MLFGPYTDHIGFASQIATLIACYVIGRVSRSASQSSLTAGVFGFVVTFFMQCFWFADGPATCGLPPMIGILGALLGRFAFRVRMRRIGEGAPKRGFEVLGKKGEE